MIYEYKFAKDWRNIDFTFGLVYPNIYDIGMSSYAIRLLYHQINFYENIACERIFLPKNIKYPAHAHHDPKSQIRSYETNRLLNEFDILGFSIQYENDFKNILWIIEDSQIPILSKKREELRENGKEIPLIIAGGPVITSNPLPFSLFFDLMFIGDSEANLDIFFLYYKDYKNNKISYEEFLKQYIDGIYVPTLENQVRRAIQHSLDASPKPFYQVLEISEGKSIFAQNYFIEVNRGCPYQCKFCISSFHNAPFRNGSFEKIIESIEHSIRTTSFNKISLIGSCVAAHPNFYEICEYIINKEIQISIPSIRVEYLTPKIIKLLETGGVKTITIAPETGSESLRYALGKEISNEKFFSVIKKIKESKIRNIKFYFLIGLPNEEEKDIQATIDFIKNISSMGFEKDCLRINVNPLIPKLNTPYENKIDFFLNENINKLNQKYKKLINELKNLPSIKLRFQNIRDLINNAKLQALISLGDKEVSKLLTEYYLEGANFGALRKVEKQREYYIDDYFKKIKSGYVPWRPI
jgi:radical SAM superfamily enzyme YgiQ (UPF0313 family)